MGRTQVKKIISADTLFQLTDGGLDIFKKEITGFTLSKNILSPVRSERDPSFRIKKSSKSGLYIGTDYTTGEFYTGITLVQALYGLSYREAIDKIAWDFRLSNDKVESVKTTLFEKEDIESKPTEPIIYEFTEMKFQKRHHEYWNKGHLTESFLRENNAFAASHIAINKNVTKIPQDEICFIYVPKDRPYGELKILRIGPNITKAQKWRTNLDREYYFYTQDIKPGPILVAKSNKDAFINKILGYNSIAGMSENAINFIEYYPTLKERFPDNDLFLNWGSDRDAMEKTKLIQSETDIIAFLMPSNFVKEGITDNFEYVTKFGLERYDNKLKQFLNKYYE